MIAAFRGQRQSALKKLLASDAFPFSSRIREVHSDVPEGKRAQNGISYGMEQNVSVGMSYQPKLTWNLHATQDQWTARLDPVRVPALADAKTRGCNFGHSSRKMQTCALESKVQPRQFHISGLGDLDIAICPAYDRNFHLLEALDE
jgi:hypothetical protein